MIDQATLDKVLAAADKLGLKCKVGKNMQRVVICLLPSRMERLNSFTQRWINKRGENTTNTLPVAMLVAIRLVEQMILTPFLPTQR